MQELVCHLPLRAGDELMKYIAQRGEPSELTLRADRPMSLVWGDENVRTEVILCHEELMRALNSFCSNSAHAHEHSLKNGFVTYKGCRIGIGGVYSQTGIPSSISSLCIRMKRNVKGCAGAIVDKLASNRFRDGLIVFSPPGYGKTTILRDFIATVSSPPYMKKVAVVDSRGELDDSEIYRGGLVDVVEIADKGRGIEIAARTLAPEIIVCDEIGSEEADAIIRTQSGGVPLIASAHAQNIDQLYSRPSLSKLLDSGIFEYYCAISKGNNERLLDIGYTKSSNGEAVME